MDELKEALRKALRTRFGVKGAIDDDTGLFSSGLIDSLTVMDLVSLVEEQIGQAISPAEITLENFDSLNRIAQFAARVGAGGR